MKCNKNLELDRQKRTQKLKRNKKTQSKVQTQSKVKTQSKNAVRNVIKLIQNRSKKALKTELNQLSSQ
jgi:hypothetical protein